MACDYKHLINIRPQSKSEASGAKAPRTAGLTAGLKPRPSELATCEMVPSGKQDERLCATHDTDGFSLALGLVGGDIEVDQVGLEAAGFYCAVGHAQDHPDGA